MVGLMAIDASQTRLGTVPASYLLAVDAVAPFSQFLAVALATEGGRVVQGDDGAIEEVQSLHSGTVMAKGALGDIIHVFQRADRVRIWPLGLARLMAALAVGVHEGLCARHKGDVPLGRVRAWDHQQGKGCE
jgi:hypothetical protein